MKHGTAKCEKQLIDKYIIEIGEICIVLKHEEIWMLMTEIIAIPLNIFISEYHILFPLQFQVIY